MLWTKVLFLCFKKCHTIFNQYHNCFVFFSLLSCWFNLFLAKVDQGQFSQISDSNGSYFSKFQFISLHFLHCKANLSFYKEWTWKKKKQSSWKKNKNQKIHFICNFFQSYRYIIIMVVFLRALEIFPWWIHWHTFV